MGLTWMPVVVAGCVALASCIAAAVFRPMDVERGRLRPLANAQRLTRLPQYVRAVRARTRTALVTIALLLVMFAAAIVVGARPSGLPTSAKGYGTGEPEDVMLCIGSPGDDPAVSQSLGYFAGAMDTFTTQRFGLTSWNRRVIPLTRDYQYAKQTLSVDGGTQRGDVAALTSAVSYEDYSENVQDLLALCLTGFPGFDREAAQRRSLIYVGPDAPPRPDARGPALFTPDRVRDLARAGGVQVDSVVIGSNSGTLAALSRDTGGRSPTADASMTAALDDIRRHPPARRISDEATELAATAESPDVPALIALATAVALAGWPMVQRR